MMLVPCGISVSSVMKILHGDGLKLPTGPLRLSNKNKKIP